METLTALLNVVAALAAITFFISVPRQLKVIARQFIRIAAATEDLAEAAGELAEDVDEEIITS